MSGRDGGGGGGGNNHPVPHPHITFNGTVLNVTFKNIRTVYMRDMYIFNFDAGNMTMMTSSPRGMDPVIK